MRYSIEPRGRRYVKGYGFLSFAKNTDKITSASKKSSKELPSNEANNEIPKERYISPQERQQIIDELRLI